MDKLVGRKLNINSLATEFDKLKASVIEKLMLEVIVEIKLGETFLSDPFSINGFPQPITLHT